MVFLGTSSEHRNGNSGDSEENEREGRIRVGKDYQATPPTFIFSSDRRPEQCPERALLVWSPSNGLSNGKLDEYIRVSKEKYGYNAEQALGMLFWHKHDLDRAIQDLANFTPFPDEWSVEDKVLFEQAFQFHGKSFHRIRQMLPDKSIPQLVKYYYSWKKTRTRTSLMDRQARKLQRIETSDKNSDEECEKETPTASSSDSSKPKCFNCGILCHVTNSTPKGPLCGTCHQYYSRTGGQLRPTSGPARKDGIKSGKHHLSLFKNKSKPPRGMYVNHDDLLALATGPLSQGDSLLKSMDREIVSYKRTVQSNKQLLSSHNIQSTDIDPYRLPTLKHNARWTNEELLLGVQGIRNYGKNFKMIADIIGTKSESHVRNFFINYRRRYNLDAALKEYETENGGQTEEDENLTKLDFETSGSFSPNSPPQTQTSPIVSAKSGGNPISAK